MGYNVLCTRCNGTGRHDRGVCFGCKGYGSKVQQNKPRTTARGLIPWLVEAERIDGSGIGKAAIIYCVTPKQAIEIVERELRCTKKPNYKPGTCTARSYL